MKVCEIDFQSFELESFALIMQPKLAEEAQKKDGNSQSAYNKKTSKSEDLTEMESKFLRKNNRRSSTQKSSQINITRTLFSKESSSTLNFLKKGIIEEEKEIIKENNNINEQEEELRHAPTKDSKKEKLQSSLNYNDFAKIAFTLLYNKEETTNKFYKFHHHLISGIFDLYESNSEIISWDYLEFTFFSLLKKCENKPAQFYKIITSMEDTSDLKWGVLESRLKEFFFKNLVEFTEIVIKNLKKDEEHTGEELRSLIDEKFNKENIISVIELISTNLKEHLKVGNLYKHHIVSQDEMSVLFKNYEFLFEFVEMRNFFIMKY